ncbi:Bax inhibitor-1/YccA family protein [Alicyclobacillus acidiphilus]|uniref:Bax inhibitor-1/YccA family protein n=1 Tax=Alicyclobacillus acidiphilus TaxID=182455 RepID=UPI000B0F9670|nr:Bax inhibitor-1/YccA family protein [Alicyclobacillus acidiphilus]
MQSYSLSQNKVLSRVFLGLCGTLLASMCGVIFATQLPYSLIRWLVVLEICMFFVAMFMQTRRSIGFGFVYAFTFVSGMTLWPVISYYATTLGAGLVIQAIAVTAGSFLATAVIASRSSMDFSFLRGFLLVGSIALLLMMIVSLFTGFSSTMELTYSLLGIAIFVGYILFDVNRIARYGVSEQYVPWIVLSLYLDFVNLFLFILRLMGVLGGSSNRR